jgi:hypothetical protein
MWGDRAKERFEYLWRDELELNPRNLKGKVKRGLGRSFCFQSWGFSLVESSNHHGLWERWKWEEGGEVFTVWGSEGMVNDRGERRKGGKRIPFIVAPRTDAGRHRSDRWRSPVRPVIAAGQSREAISVFPAPLGRTEDPDKIQQRVFIGRTDTPLVVPSLFLLFEILLLEASPKML